jgi:hypothetical protein
MDQHLFQACLVLCPALRAGSLKVKTTSDFAILT